MSIKTQHTAMLDIKSKKIELLKREIRAYKAQLAFAGWCLIIAFILIPISIVTRSRIIGISVISFIVGNFIAAGACAAKINQEATEKCIQFIESEEEPATFAEENMQKDEEAIDYGFRPIGLN